MTGNCELTTGNSMTDANRDCCPIRLLSFALGLTTLAFIIAKTGRDALFFQGSGGLLQLPLIYINIGAASLPLAILFVKAMKVWGARPARIGVLALIAAVMGGSAPFLYPGDNKLMLGIFMFIPASFGLLFASLWLLASDIFEKTEKREAARAFSRIGAATLAGGMIGGLLSKGLAPFLEPRWLILLAALVLLVVIGFVRYVHRIFATDIGSKTNKEKKPGWLTPLRNRYAFTLLLISMTGAFSGLLIDFQFYAAAAGARMGSQGNADFFANFYILLNFSSLLLQLFATPKIQEKIGLRGGLMVLPFALIGGATFATAAATAFSRSALRVTEGGLRSSVHRSVWEQAFIPVDSAERSSVKIAVDGMAARIAEAIGAIAILLWLKQVVPNGSIAKPLDTQWISWVLLVTVTTWLLITQKLSVQVKQEKLRIMPPRPEDIECERFPDQCPCTTEFGKGVA